MKKILIISLIGFSFLNANSNIVEIEKLDGKKLVAKCDMLLDRIKKTSNNIYLNEDNKIKSKNNTIKLYKIYDCDKIKR